VPKRHDLRFGGVEGLHRCPKLLCYHDKDDHSRMEKDMTKAIAGSLDHDLAFEAADVLVDGASIIGYAFVSGVQ
jgi:hypothetical protein